MMTTVKMTAFKGIACLLACCYSLSVQAEGYINPYRIPQQPMRHYNFAPTYFRPLSPASAVGSLTSTAGIGLQSTTNPASSILPSRPLYPPSAGRRLGALSPLFVDKAIMQAPQHGWLLPDGRFIAEKHKVESPEPSVRRMYPKSHFVIINPKGRLSACSGAATCEFPRAF